MWASFFLRYLNCRLLQVCKLRVFAADEWRLHRSFPIPFLSIWTHVFPMSVNPTLGSAVVSFCSNHEHYWSLAVPVFGSLAVSLPHLSVCVFHRACVRLRAFTVSLVVVSSMSASSQLLSFPWYPPSWSNLIFFCCFTPYVCRRSTVLTLSDTNMPSTNEPTKPIKYPEHTNPVRRFVARWWGDAELQRRACNSAAHSMKVNPFFQCALFTWMNETASYSTHLHTSLIFSFRVSTNLTAIVPFFVDQDCILPLAGLHHVRGHMYLLCAAGHRLAGQRR